MRRAAFDFGARLAAARPVFDFAALLTRALRAASFVIEPLRLALRAPAAELLLERPRVLLAALVLELPAADRPGRARPFAVPAGDRPEVLRLPAAARRARLALRLFCGGGAFPGARLLGDFVPAAAGTSTPRS